jgi:hypothetical protein
MKRRRVRETDTCAAVSGRVNYALCHRRGEWNEAVRDEGGVWRGSLDSTFNVPLPPPVITTTKPLAEKRFEGLKDAWTFIFSVLVCVYEGVFMLWQVRLHG